jgi:hypothetical protein
VRLAAHRRASGERWTAAGQCGLGLRKFGLGLRQFGLQLAVGRDRFSTRLGITQRDTCPIGEAIGDRPVAR